MAIKNPRDGASCLSYADRMQQDHLIVEKAVKLSLIEIALGSLLHAFKVPLAGHFLSLNQGLFLTRLAREFSARLITFRVVIETSVIVSLMKSLSPAGKKLGPMLSISMQGAFFALGILFAGNNLLGLMLGMVFLSLWGFIQPFITYFLIYGPDLLKAFEYFLDKLNLVAGISEQSVYLFIAIIIGIKGLVAMSIPALWPALPQHYINFYDRLLSVKKITRAKEKTVLKGVWKDMTRPFFLFSMLLMFLFFYLTGDKLALLFWKILRTLALSFILFYLSRNEKFFAFMMNISARNKKLERILKLSQQAYGKIINQNL